LKHYRKEHFLATTYLHNISKYIHETFILVEYDALTAKNARNWSIKRNKRQNKVKIDYVTIQGNCCWRTCDRKGNCDNFGLNEEKQPRFSFIKKIRAFEC